MKKTTTNIKAPTYVGLTLENRTFLNKITQKGGFKFGSRYLNGHLDWLRKQGLEKAIKQVVTKA